MDRRTAARADSQASAMGRALGDAMEIVLRPAGNAPNTSFKALHPIIVQTTLAASVAAYLERISWATVALQLLGQHRGSLLENVSVAANIMNKLFGSVSRSSLLSNANLPALFLRQVYIYIYTPRTCRYWVTAFLPWVGFITKHTYSHGLEETQISIRD